MTDPHPVPDEDPEQHIGEPVDDPWDDRDDAKRVTMAPAPEEEGPHLSWPG